MNNYHDQSAFDIKMDENSDAIKSGQLIAVNSLIKEIADYNYSSFLQVAIALDNMKSFLECNDE